MISSTSLVSLAKALSCAQGELHEAAKSSFNPGFKSKYADLAEVLQVIRPVAVKHGLSYVQGVGYSDGLATVTTRILHASGEYLEDVVTIPVTKKDAQGVGSAFTYGRRYALAAMFGISQDDDDGNAAVTKTKVHTSTVAVTVASLKAEFDKATDKADLDKLATTFAQLTPDEQTAILPIAKAARARVEASAMG